MILSGNANIWVSSTPKFSVTLLTLHVCALPIESVARLQFGLLISPQCVQGAPRSAA